MNTSSNTKSAASEQAYDQIRHDIVSGVLKENERLTEQALAKRIGLSRTPVREAIKRLIHEGFIESESGYSTRVASFSADEAEQVFQLRIMLEGYAIRRAASFATQDQVNKLRSLATHMTRLVDAGISNEHDEIARHRTIADAAKSTRLTALISVAIDVGLVARTYRSYSEDALVRSCRHHHEMVDAIAAKSPEWAESVMTSHLLAAQATTANIHAIANTHSDATTN